MSIDPIPLIVIAFIIALSLVVGIFYAWLLAQVIWRAYFTAKLDYQVNLMRRLETDCVPQEKDQPWHRT